MHSIYQDHSVSSCACVYSSCVSQMKSFDWARVVVIVSFERYLNTITFEQISIFVALLIDEFLTINGYSYPFLTISLCLIELNKTNMGII